MHTSKGSFFFKVISGTFWRCLQYKAKQYFEGEDEMVCRSWQYYVNDRCVKGNDCSCLERIFRNKTSVFLQPSKIWFFPLVEKKKWGQNKKHRYKVLVWVPSKLFSEFVMETETILRPHTISSYNDATAYPLHSWNVLLNLTAYSKAIEKNCFKQSLSFSEELLEILRLNFFGQNNVSKWK